MQKYLIPLSLCFFITGCQKNFAYSECTTTNWHDLGKSAGEQGMGYARFITIEDYCTKIGIQPSHSDFEEGRAEGLKTYCSASRGLELGRKGKSKSSECSRIANPKFYIGYDLGKQIRLVKTVQSGTRRSNASSQYDPACGQMSSCSGNQSNSVANNESNASARHELELLEKQAAELLSQE